MNVLSVLHGNTYGGPHNRNARIAPVLATRHGIHLTVMLPKEPGDAAGRLRDQDLDVVEVPVASLRAKADPRHHIAFATGLAKNVLAIRRVIREHAIDLVIVNGISNPHAAIAARSLGVPIVWQILDSFPPKAFLSLMMPYVRRSAGAIMSTGERIASMHLGQRIERERLVLFHPPVDVERFRFDPAARAASRIELGLPVNGPIIGNVSNINPQKGHLTFVRAAAFLKRERPDCRFVILGQRYAAHAGHFRRLVDEARAHGINLGSDLVIADPGSRVAELASAFDVFWMTSEPRSEGIPTALEEAMALGLPAVAADVGSIREIVIEGRTGFVVPPRDWQATARATMRILDDPDLRGSLAIEARAFAERNFTIGQCADKHAEAIETARQASLPDTNTAPRRRLSRGAWKAPSKDR